MIIKTILSNKLFLSFVFAFLLLNNFQILAQAGCNSLTTSVRQLGNGPVDDTQNINLSSLGVSVGDQITVSNLLADGDMNGGTEVFSLSINGGTAITGLQTDEQCEGTLIPLTSPINETVNVIDIGGGTPGITLRVQYTNDINFCTNALEYTVDISYCERSCTNSVTNIDELQFENGSNLTINGNSAVRFNNVATGVNAEVIDLGGFVTNIDTDVVESPESLTSILNTNVTGDRSSQLQINFYDATSGNGFDSPLEISFYATVFDIDGQGSGTLREYVDLDSPDVYKQESTGSAVTITQNGVFPSGSIRGQAINADVNIDTQNLENPDHAFTTYYVNKSSFNYTIGKIGASQAERFYTLAFKDVTYVNPSITANTKPKICGTSLLDNVPQAGVTIELYDASNNLIDSSITDSNGEFVFEVDINSGIYNIREMNTANTISTADSDGGPNFDDVEVNIGLNSSNVTFENASDNDNDGVEDFVDLDDDNDGILDTDECSSVETVGELSYELYDSAPSGLTVDNIPSTGADDTGTISNFDVTSLANAATGSAETFSIRYTGKIKIDVAGAYTFYTNSDDGSKLFIDGVEIVDNDGDHPVQEESGVVSLSAGFHSIEILYYENGGLEELDVLYEGPSITKITIPFSILYSSSELCEDTDNDGIPNNLDLDSDGDGCSDANEYYLDNSADGGDDDVFGSGTPSVDADGLVIAAGYDGSGYATVVNEFTNACTDSDIDGIVNVIDLDDDNDGILDGDEASCVNVEAYWPLDNNTNDISGNNNNERPDGNAPSFSSEAIQGSHSASFNGTSNSIRYSQNGGFMESSYTQISFSTWIKPTDLSGQRVIYEEGGGTNGLILWLDNGTPTLSARNGGAGSQTDIASSTSISNNLWYHIAGTFDNGVMTIYVNGDSNSTTASFSTIPPHGSDGGLGASFGGTSAGINGFYSGLMDAVKYSNTIAWNASDIDFNCDIDGNAVVNRLDLDSDGDGCSDANEYYESNNADGGDDAVFGTGTPSVDADGLVIAAGYDGTNLAATTDDTVVSGCDFIQDVAGDWSTASNWNFDLVPTLDNNAIIRANSTVSSNQAVNNLTVDPTFTVSVNDGNTLNLKGNLTNNGDFDGAGYVVFDGNSAQSIDGDGSDAGSFTNIRVNNSAGVTLTDDADLFETLDLDNGDFNIQSGDFLTFKSNASGTAVLSEVASGSTVSGCVIVERYIPASNRAFRYTAASVNTTVTCGKETIRDNIQEGNSVSNIDDYTGISETPGFGTHVTGSTVGANGFDATITGNPSMFSWDESTQQWGSVPNTDTQTFNVGDPYSLLVRGGRELDLRVNNFQLGSATTLRFTGELETGDVNVTNLATDIDQYSLVANPYQAQVDMKALLESSDANNLSSSFMYIYDPTLGTRGGYATVDLTTTNGSSTPSGSGANKFLQPNQAFFIKNTAAAPSLTFKETYKKAVDQSLTNETFSIDQTSVITANLKRAHDNSFKLVDGIKIMLNQNFDNTVLNNDAPKFWNSDESIAIEHNNNWLAVERRQIPEPNESIQLFIWDYKNTDYQIELKLGNLDQTQIKLKDHYTNDIVELPTNQAFTYNFTANSSIPESVSNTRFELIFEQVSLNINDITENNISVYPNPVVDVLNIDIPQIAGQEVTLELVDMAGRLISKETLTAHSNTITTHATQNLSAGVYNINIQFDNKNFNKKIIVK
ncbi:LamG-like jellyroll fold domain-containing protein [Psychroflexus sp. ALD_RP9]|uniref:LamG-like jellyroll fold domain-containing protein n=1 Tax=Psychroflexus sp. ALD_RP9 TaxID=2777186 RepID=UPI001A8CC038|nr:LamG-like jellyroll fold domain-containing protein [Psychroflexus sp. ALD_RP9]QSS98262.1 T9SS type A sorting domain-containing protein [Psychroflexus sp. ALD_RP9]